MRKLTTLALALSATLSFAGLAQADEYLTAQNKEFYAVAAESAAEATKPAPAVLGYADTSATTAQVNAIFASHQQPASADQLMFKLGDRGLGNN